MRSLNDYIRERLRYDYDPLTDTYKVNTGGKRVVIPSYVLRAENVNFLEKGLNGIKDERVRQMLGLCAGIDYTGVHLDDLDGACIGPQGPGVYADTTGASLYSVYADNDSTWAATTGSYRVTHSWEAPLLEQKIEDTIIFMEDLVFTEDLDPSQRVKVYHHDRYAGIPWNLLVDEAAKLLYNKKDLDIHIKYKQAEPDGAMVSYEVHNGFKRTIACVVLSPDVFDRKYTTTIDDFARLMKKFDTHTYIVLRIAYILGFIYKLDDSDALKLHRPEAKILRHVTEPNL